ncbi:MAG: hypothetical protein ACMUIE_02105 [Thermoplasmatota archaeon]
MKRRRLLLGILIGITLLLILVNIYLFAVRSEIWISEHDVKLEIVLGDDAIRPGEEITVNFELTNNAETPLLYSGYLMLFLESHNLTNNETIWLTHNDHYQINIDDIECLDPGETRSYEMKFSHIQFTPWSNGTSRLKGMLHSIDESWSLTPCWEGIVVSPIVSYQLII